VRTSPIRYLLATLQLAAALLACGELLAGAEPAATTNVVLKTDLGDITIALETVRAPVTAANFLKYVDGKRFDGTSIYRAVKIGDEGKFGLVQGGLSGSTQQQDGTHQIHPGHHLPEDEAPEVTGLRSVDGAVSMARNEPGSARSEYFFIVGDLPSLDGVAGTDDEGYAVFGQVVSGMDLVRTILLLPRKEDAEVAVMKGQMLQQPVKVISARRAE
jgi:peptidyl-prolyl cis-trans isomerase A (cyclophilin A)